MAIQRKNKNAIKSKKQRGGSPASDLVMEAYTGSPAMNDYVTSPRIRDGSMSDNFSGGSQASDYMTDNIKNIANTKPFPSSFTVNGDMASINNYLPSGGSRKSNKRRSHKNKRRSNKNRKTNKSQKNNSRNYKKNKSNKRNSNRNKSNKRNHRMAGGGSDWMSSQYSLGSYNSAEMSAGDVGKFSSSLPGSRANYMNPPNLGLAGSGAAMGSLEGANVRMIGSPLV